MFSKACEYGLRATIYIAGQSLSGRKTSLKEIAESIASPESFTSKILQQLSRSEIIHSDKGPTGGFSMNPHQLETVKLSSIVAAIDGDHIYKGCGLGLEQCNEKKPCPLHDQFKGIRGELKNMLETTPVKELALGLKGGLTMLKR
ncbi:MAG: Rrf2 family transcriptional regulator [Haliscomenobacteraceae bacterium CHB4]|nr:Rrf2 family transcriptional regulator [Haliscomenobacteraceae bacterium CHB4]